MSARLDHAGRPSTDYTPATSPYLFRTLADQYARRPAPHAVLPPQQPPRLPPDCEPDSLEPDRFEPVPQLEAEHPWLWALYAVVAVASIAASAAWPYWVQP